MTGIRRAIPCALLALVTVGSSPTGAAASGPEIEALHRRLQTLDVRVQERLAAAVASDDLEGLATRLAADASELRREIETLTGAIASESGAAADTLIRKLEGVRLLVDDLERVAERRAVGSPPAAARLERGVPVSDLDRSSRTRPANDTRLAATIVGFGVLTGDTTNATRDGSATCGVSDSAPDVWFRFVPDASGAVVIETAGSSFDTVLSLHSGDCPDRSGCELSCDDDSYGLQSALSAVVDASREYLVRLSGYDDACGPYILTIGRAGGVGGTVLDEVGRGVDCRVTAFDSHGTSSRFAFTTPEGRYRIGGLAAGEYHVATTSCDAGFLTRVWGDDPSGSGVSPTAGDPVTVPVWGEVQSVDFEFERCGSVSGTVTEAGTGMPVVGARMRMRADSGAILGSIQGTVESSDGVPLSHAYVRVKAPDGSTVTAGFCAADGSYEIGGLADGTYYVVAHHVGYEWELFEDVLCPAGACNLALGTPVVVAGHGTVSGVDFSLVTLPRIQGTVRDAVTRLPIPWARLRVVDPSNQIVDFVNGASDGTYSSDWIPQGSYAVYTDMADYVNELYDDIPCIGGCTYADGTPISVSYGSDTTGIDLDLAPDGWLMGTVREVGTGDPLAGVRVGIYSPTGAELYSTYSQASGAYSAVVGGGTYYVATDDWPYGEHLDQLYDGIPCAFGPPWGCDPVTGVEVVVDDGSATTGIDFDLPPGGRITGAITDAIDGSPVGSVEIRVRHLPLGYTKIRSVPAAGLYEVGGLPTGQYSMLVLPSGTYLDEWYRDRPCPGPWPQGCPTQDPDPIPVIAGSETPGIDFTLDRLGRISGHLLAEENGLPIPDSRVSVHYPTGGVQGSRPPGPDGGYSLGGLWPGTYYVYGSDDEYLFVGELFDDVPCFGGPLVSGCDVADGTPIIVTANSTVDGIDLRLDRTGAIAGRVSDEASGVGLAGLLEIEVWDPDGERIGGARVDAVGQYLADRLPPGTYFVSTDDAWRHDRVDELFDDIPCPDGVSWGGCDPRKGDPVVVRSGETTRFVDFRLAGDEPGIAGTVSSLATGRGLAGIAVDVWDAADSSHEGVVFTGDDGRYRIGTDEGTFFVTTDNDQGFVNLIYDGILCPGGSAYGGDCDPATGEAVVVEGGLTTPGVDFAMRRPPVFQDGFESGDLGAWSVGP